MYHISHINQVVSNSTSSAILYILTNHSPVLEGAHYVYKHAHTVSKSHYTDIYIWIIKQCRKILRINVKFKHTHWVIINNKA